MRLDLEKTPRELYIESKGEVVLYKLTYALLGLLKLNNWL